MQYSQKILIFANIWMENSIQADSEQGAVLHQFNNSSNTISELLKKGSKLFGKR